MRAELDGREFTENEKKIIQIIMNDSSVKVNEIAETHDKSGCTFE